MIPSEPQATSGPWPITLTLVIWLMISLFALFRYTAIPAKSIDHPEYEFSAARAEQYFAAIINNDIPHPAGSEDNQKVRQTIAGILESFGYDVEVHSSTQSVAPSPRFETGGDVPLNNLIAIHPGNQPDLGAVCLAAHFDSTPFGPGASDDGIAVAALLEVARMTKQQIDSGRDIVFLFTDGEELGLLGAKKFVEQHPLASRIEFVFNFEARGTSGPSAMFQTSADSNEIIRQFAKHAKRPITSSMFEEVYKRMPNDTDFTIFRDTAGWRGMNFAFIGDVLNYHTKNDNFENASRDSLQHHGDHAWRMLSAFHHLPATERRDETTVYFDLLGYGVVYYSQTVSIVLSVICTLYFALVVTRLSNITEIIKCAFQSAALVLNAGLIAWTIYWLLALEGRFQPPWVQHPHLLSTSFWSISLSGVLLVGSLIHCSNSVVASSTIWLGWSALALFSSVYVSGISYLFLIPSSSALIFNVFQRSIQFDRNAEFVLSSSMTAIIWMPIGILFYDAIGFSTCIVLIARISFLSTTLVPLLAVTKRTTISNLSLLGILIATAVTIVAVLKNPAA